MDTHGNKSKNDCCINQSNIVEVDGFFTCSACRVVADHTPISPSDHYRTQLHTHMWGGAWTRDDEFQETCDRGCIAHAARVDGYRLYKKWVEQCPLFNKLTLKACAILQKNTHTTHYEGSICIHRCMCKTAWAVLPYIG